MYYSCTYEVLALSYTFSSNIQHVDLIIGCVRLSRTTTHMFAQTRIPLEHCALRIEIVTIGQERDLLVHGLFYAIGHEPATALVCLQLLADPWQWLQWIGYHCPWNGADKCQGRVRC
ncbi:hypothetical protein BDR07DRAFT_1429602 [Suillus spraguei]|nr:hypothetical protein BDR07DRAFT_1429602 [Suillus spraguei]